MTSIAIFPRIVNEVAENLAGYVEQLDTEVFEDYAAAGLHDDPLVFLAVEERQFSPPILTKTWFHQGPIGDEFGEWQEIDYDHEYWYSPDWTPYSVHTGGLGEPYYAELAFRLHSEPTAGAEGLTEGFSWGSIKALFR